MPLGIVRRLMRNSIAVAPASIAGCQAACADLAAPSCFHPLYRIPRKAAVVGMPHDIKGQGIYAFVTLNAGEPDSEDLRQELRQFVRGEIGPIASPDAIQFAPALPKTRSGKIMRRILRKIAAGDTSDLGDVSTLADPSVVEKLVEAAKAG